MDDIIKYRKILFEAESKTKTKQKSQSGIDFSDPMSKGDLATTNVDQESPSSPFTPSVASASKTAASIKPFDQDTARQAGEFMKDFDYGAIDAKYGAEPTKDITTLPATISTAVDTQDLADIEWHQVKNLPGMISSGIRTMGAKIFNEFSTTPLEDIMSLSTLTNNEADVKKMAKVISRYGTKNDAGTIELGNMIPGYNAKMVVYDFKGFQYMIIQDFAGYYIYGYKPKSSNELSQPSNQIRLPR